MSEDSPRSPSVCPSDVFPGGETRGETWRTSDRCWDELVGDVIHQDLHGGGLDGDVDGVQIGLFDPPHPLDVHVQDADEVLGLNVFYGSFAAEIRQTAGR